jgi:hypothetical protein
METAKALEKSTGVLLLRVLFIRVVLLMMIDDKDKCNECIMYVVLHYTKKLLLIVNELFNSQKYSTFG